MLTAADLLHIPYTPDLTEAGIAYACRSLASGHEYLGDFAMAHLRKIVADVAVELAFRRYLSEQATPFQVLETEPFTRPDQYDISLGGHRCKMKCCLVTRRDQIRQIRHNKSSLLQAQALVPIERFASEEAKPDDLYLFAFLLGLITVSPTEIEKALAAGQPAALLHLLPKTWARPGNWTPFERLTIKSECTVPITLELGGQDAERNLSVLTLELPSRQRLSVETNFHNLAYVRANRKPEARIGLHAAQLGDTYLIPANAWGNLWVYGMEVIFTGWLTHENYRRKASVLNAGSRTFLIEHTRAKNLLVPVAKLNPLGLLLQKVRAWYAEKKA